MRRPRRAIPRRAGRLVCRIGGALLCLAGPLAADAPAKPDDVQACTSCHVKPGEAPKQHAGKDAPAMAVVTDGKVDQKSLLSHQQCVTCHKSLEDRWTRWSAWLCRPKGWGSAAAAAAGLAAEAEGWLWDRVGMVNK